MRKLVMTIIAVACAVIANASDINFVKNKTWKQVLALAKAQKKIIFLDAYATWCGPCKYMDSDVYTDDAVADFYNANFINIKMDMEAGEGISLSDEFEVTAYPTFLFINGDGKILHKSVGGMEPNDFIELGKDAKNPATQYYSLKKKIQQGLTSDADFLKWANYAKRLSDNDLSPWVNRFLKTKSDILLNEYVTTTTLKYADSLSETQWQYLVKNEIKIQQQLKITKREAWRKVYDKVFNHALKRYNKTKDENSFYEEVRKLDPTKADLALKDLRLRVALYVKENSADAAEMLYDYLVARYPIKPEDFIDLFTNNVEEFANADFERIGAAVAEYFGRYPEDKNNGWLLFVHAICLHQAGEIEKGKVAARKVLADASMPDDYKEVLKGVFGL